MAKLRIAKMAAGAVALILAAGVAAPFVDAEGYRARIESALERALNRKVRVGKVRYNLFTGPGFTVSDVEIEDDASVGIEPLAYVESLEARVTLKTLWTRRLAFSNLKLKNPTLNLVKTDSGVWNFQLLRPAAGAGALPTIQVRDGRIDFKFGDTKSVFYLSESDLDISPIDEHRMDVRFSGQPARTDHAAQSFGLLLARGVWRRTENAESELDVNAELEKSAISELSRLFEAQGLGLHGMVSSRAHLSGPISNLAFSGQVKIEDVHRWDLLQKGGGWQLTYRGRMDLKDQKLEVETAEKDNPGLPVIVRFRATNLMSAPRWAASVDLHDVPAGAVLEAATHMGATFPEGMQADGKLNGAVGFTPGAGFQGQLSAKDATVKSPGAPVVRFPSAGVLIDGSRIRVGPSTVEAESGQTAELTAEYRMDDGGIDVNVVTAGMNTGELQKGVGVNVPLLGAVSDGHWKGLLRYSRAGSEPGSWSGDVELRECALEVPGLRDPLRVTSALVSIAEKRVAITRIHGRAGEIKFTGEYRLENARPDRIKLEIPEADVVALERLFMPTLRRKQGLLARFRLRAAPAPEWLRERRVDGTLKIEKLVAGEQIWQVPEARLEWTGTSVLLTGLEAAHGDVTATGQLSVDLAGQLPAYHATGKVSEIPYKGGTLALEGTIKTRGTGQEALVNAHAEGTFEGENLSFASDLEFKAVTAAFDWIAPAKLRVRNLQGGQGFENFTGQGATQSDGKLLLELTSARRQVKVAGTLLAAPARER